MPVSWHVRSMAASGGAAVVATFDSGGALVVQAGGRDDGIGDPHRRESLPPKNASCLRHSIDACRDVHGNHSDQTASENLQGRMATRRAVEEIPDNEEQ
jgi:hypothetical protein